MQPENLTAVPQQIWRCLSGKRGDWQKPVLATALPGGGADARVVLLRHVFPEERELIFFSDRRLAKIPQLQADPRVCLVIYDRKQELQVRLYGGAQRERHHATLDEWWAELPDWQRRVYRVDGDEASTENERGRENFSAFRIQIARFHCLWSGQAGDTAAVFEWREDGWRGESVRQ